MRMEIESAVQLGAWDHGGYMCIWRLRVQFSWEPGIMVGTCVCDGGIHLSVLYSLNCVSCDQLMVFTVQVVGP